MANINELVAKWRAVVKQRSELDRLSKTLKNGLEADLKAQILMYLAANSLPGIKAEVGFVTQTQKEHLEIQDLEKFLQKQAALFDEARAKGRPLADALLLQRTPLRSEINSQVLQALSLSEKDKVDDNTYNTVATASYGVRRVSVSDLSFRSR